MAELDFNVNKISKKYTDQVGYSINLLKAISFNSNVCNFITLLAPVGSGKSTLLKILAGLDNPTTGSIETRLKKRVFIPSLPSSFPWLSVYDNISFNSKLNNEELMEIISQVGLSWL